MILEVSAGSSWLVRGAAALILSLHITAAGVGIVSGAIALLARKGSHLHRKAGNWFFVSMLTMSAIGAGVAPFLPDRISTVAAVLTFYLVAAAWVTVKRQAGNAPLFEIGAAIVALCIVRGCRGARRHRGHEDRLAPRSRRLTARRATSLAHVFRAVYCRRVFFPWTAASISGVRAWVAVPRSSRDCGLGIDDLLAGSGLIYKLVQT
jgi:hypothetical protein